MGGGRNDLSGERSFESLCTREGGRQSTSALGLTLIRKESCGRRTSVRRGNLVVEDARLGKEA